MRTFDMPMDSDKFRALQNSLCYDFAFRTTVCGETISLLRSKDSSAFSVTVYLYWQGAYMGKLVMYPDFATLYICDSILKTVHMDIRYFADRLMRSTDVLISGNVSQHSWAFSLS